MSLENNSENFSLFNQRVNGIIECINTYSAKEYQEWLNDHKENAEHYFNENNWKESTKKFFITIDNYWEAVKFAVYLAFITGGYEFEHNGYQWTLKSKGYYHYIGA
jgi:hypothetical protein